MQVSGSVEIGRPIEEVWDFASDVDHMAEWMQGVSEPRMTSEGGMALGATFASKYAHRSESFDIDYEVTEYEPPRRHQISSLEGPFPFVGTLRLESVDGRTRVTNTVRAGSDALITSLFFVMLRPFFRRGMRRQLLSELEKLKELLDGPPETAGEATAGNDGES